MSRDYTISFEYRQGELRAHVTGASSMANTIAYWTEIADKVAQLDPTTLLLIDELTGSPLSAEEWRSLVEAMNGKGFERIRIAHVKPRGLEKIEFCELYAKEAGLDARVFTDTQVASLWLRHGERLTPAVPLGRSGDASPAPSATRDKPD